MNHWDEREKNAMFCFFRLFFLVIVITTVVSKGFMDHFDLFLPKVWLYLLLVKNDWLCYNNRMNRVHVNSSIRGNKFWLSSFFFIDDEPKSSHRKSAKNSFVNERFSLGLILISLNLDRRTRWDLRL